MKLPLVRVAILMGALCLSFGAAVGQQAPNSSPEKSDAKKPAKVKPEAQRAPAKEAVKLELLDATRINTEEAARSAARAREKGQPSEASGKDEPASGVLEFHPAASEREASPGRSATVKDSSGSSSQKIHGEVYGALDPQNAGTHRAGGAVGATSKSGKTSVYVQKDETRANPPKPH